MSKFRVVIRETVTSDFEYIADDALTNGAARAAALQHHRSTLRQPSFRSTVVTEVVSTKVVKAE